MRAIGPSYFFILSAYFAFTNTQLIYFALKDHGRSLMKTLDKLCT